MSLPQASDILFFLKDGEVLIAQSSKECSTADGGRATPYESYFSLVALGEFVEGREGGITDLRDLHLLEHLQSDRNIHRRNVFPCY